MSFICPEGPAEILLNSFQNYLLNQGAMRAALLVLSSKKLGVFGDSPVNVAYGDLSISVSS